MPLNVAAQPVYVMSGFGNYELYSMDLIAKFFLLHIVNAWA